MEQLLGILFHSLGGFSSASFYVPSYKIKGWAWQTYWILLGLVAWIIMPWAGALLVTQDATGVLGHVPAEAMIKTYVFGVLWGFGGLMAGLGLRFLGLSLGQSISLGVCAIVGTLVPAILNHSAGMLVTTGPGALILAGFLLCIGGIACCGYAGVLKDRQLTESQKKASVKEFAALKGIAMAVCGGVMSGFMALAIDAGAPIAEEAARRGTAKVFMNIPIFIVALGGGFTANGLFTLIRRIRMGKKREGEAVGGSLLLNNLFFTLLSGVMWYAQFFFYGMGATKMGRYGFASWTLHMATIILFSNCWGIWLKEWRGVDRRTLGYLWLGMIGLTVSVVLIGVGNHLAGAA